jgi:outer membrane lipoprotein-sorting protein
MKEAFGKISPLLAFFIFSLAAIAADDKFESIKKDFTSAKLIRFEVAMATVSKVFDDVDSARGEILIADDGRYNARLNDDIYLFDGRCIWEISGVNRQATKQCLKEGEKFENRLFFIKELDKYFSTSVIKKDRQYQLLRNAGSDNALPDSLTVYLNKSGSNITRLEYYDLNGDLNRVYILDREFSDTVSENDFRINLPDSIEVITLP